jgi:hypothetical protein
LVLDWQIVMQLGVSLRLNLAVCPSAACKPYRGAQVPHALASLAARPSAVSVSFVPWQATAHAARSRGFRHRCLALEPDVINLEGIEAVTAYAPRHRPKSSNTELLHRRLCIRQNLWQSMQAQASQRRPKFKNQGKVSVFSTPSTALTRLTNRSTRTIMLRIIAG